MCQDVTTIALPTRPQPDTIVAIFLLRQFGKEEYPGVETATVAVEPKATTSPAKLLIDVGGSEFDHHGTGKCAAELVAEKLDVAKNPELRQMIAYARRDDTQGKGIISKDPIDRAFGLSGLIASLNKQFPKDADRIVKTVLPLLEAQYQNAYEHYVALPKLVEECKVNKNFRSESVDGEFKNIKIAFLTSDHTGLPGYLRSSVGGNYKVVVQRRSTDHVNIITKQNPKLDLRFVMSLLRLREAELHKVDIDDQSSLTDTGSHKAVPNWYYDTATNSLLNGGVSPDDIEPTVIPWEEMQAIILYGLENTSR